MYNPLYNAIITEIDEFEWIKRCKIAILFFIKENNVLNYYFCK